MEITTVVLTGKEIKKLEAGETMYSDDSKIVLKREEKTYRCGDRFLWADNVYMLSMCGFQQGVLVHLKTGLMLGVSFKVKDFSKVTTEEIVKGVKETTWAEIRDMPESLRKHRGRPKRLTK